MSFSKTKVMRKILYISVVLASIIFYAVPAQATEVVVKGTRSTVFTGPNGIEISCVGKKGTCARANLEKRTIQYTDENGIMQTVKYASYETVETGDKTVLKITLP